MEKALTTPEICRFIPDLPKSHKLNKDFLIAVIKVFYANQVINYADPGWLLNTYGEALRVHAQRKLEKKNAVLNMKDEVRNLFENTLQISSILAQ